MFRITKKKAQLALSLFCLTVMLYFHYQETPYITHLIKQMDGVIYDYLVNLSLPVSGRAPEPPRVVVIDIDDKSIQQEGRWPWPRDKLALLVDNLKKTGVVVSAFDIVLSEAEINYAQGLKEKISHLSLKDNTIKQQMIPLLETIAPQVDNDQTFVKSLQNNDVVLGFLFHHDDTIKKGALPSPLLDEKADTTNSHALQLYNFEGFNGILALFLANAHHGGFVSNVPDIDGIIRHGLLVASFDNKLYGSLALMTVMRYLLVDKISFRTHLAQGKQILDGINLDKLFIPTNVQGQVLIPFWGLPGTIDYFSASDVMQGKIPAGKLAGAVAIIGSTNVLLADIHPSPVSQSFPGVEMNANLVAALINSQIPTELDWHNNQGLMTISFVSLIITLLFTLLGPITLIILYLFIILASLVCCLLLFSYKKIYIPVMFIVLLTTLQAAINFVYAFVIERKNKNSIRHLFSQYVPPSYVKELIESPQFHNMDGENREMTVFFADIRSFTTLSEELDAQEVKRLLNTFFTPITEIIFENQGTIDKYIGDMVVALWGAPLVDAHHSRHAIEASLTIREKLPAINDKLIQLNLPAISLGIGLNTGLMNVGDMGSKFRRAYTVIGDNVNLASRLQDLTKFYQVNVLVSDSTRANQDDFVWQPIDKVVVKGRSKAVMIYEPLGYVSNASPLLLAEINDYEQALNAYFAKKWASAKNQFEQLMICFPNKFLYQLYAMRIEEFMKTPPPDNWQGEFIHTHK